MKSKSKSAWLITWEGPDSECNGRCKIVAILPPQCGEKGIRSLLRVLYCSEYCHTLCDKLGFSAASRSNPLFQQPYSHINPEFCYGFFPKEYLCARKVDNLRCEESKKDYLEGTLYWTERERFIIRPDRNENDPLPDNPADLLKQVSGKIPESYTYSIRPAIEAEKARRAKHNAP
jgi:hypothetical protein